MPLALPSLDRLLEKVIRLLAARSSLAVFVLLCLLAAVSLGLNLTNQKTSYGTFGGLYEDQVDSFSEYLVRNTVRYGVETGDASAPNLYITAGYPDDFDYVAEGIRPYYSNRGIQANAYTWIALALGDRFTNHPKSFFSAMRFANALLISVIAFVFFGFLFGRTGLSAAAALVFTHLSGIALFSANLYFQAWAFLLPLAAYPLLSRGQSAAYLAAAFAGSTLYFTMRYEFATTFALLWLLPVLMTQAKPVKLGLAAFVLSCAGFALALYMHHAHVAGALGITLGEATELILPSARTRTMTIEGVPIPFTSGFFVEMARRLNLAAFSLPFVVTLPKYVFWAIFVALALTARDQQVRWLLIWAVIAYLSWYVFAYQHIMWHSQYDWLLFAVTIQLALLVVLGTRVRATIQKSASVAAGEFRVE
jgi:hypothetical protein